MKISIILPPMTTDWQGNIIRELIALRYQVEINTCSDDCDVMIVMSHTQWQKAQRVHEEYPKVPMITINWDWYDYIDKKVDGWPEFTQLMRESKEIWTSSKAEADKCEKDTGLKSDFYTYAFILPWEWEDTKSKDLGFVFQASRKDNNKRFDWFMTTADKLGISYKAYHPKDNSRMDYINTMRNCSIWVLASREESIGGLGTMEASFCMKPALISDCGGNKEVWGDDVWYFDRDSKFDFENKLRWLWENRNSDKVSKKVNRAHQRVKDKFTPWVVAKRFDERLKKIL